MTERVFQRQHRPGSAPRHRLRRRAATTDSQRAPMLGARVSESESERATMSKSVTLQLGEEVYEELREAAAAERRPLANLIETAALARIREAQFVDDVETAETLGNEALVRRLKVGSRQARRREGHFVE